MAETIKVLGQDHNNGSETDVYETPADTTAVVASVAVCCFTDTHYSVMVAPQGEATHEKHFIFKDKAITSGQSDIHKLGITLASTDVIRFVCDNNGDATINIFGIEIT